MGCYRHDSERVAGSGVGEGVKYGQVGKGRLANRSHALPIPLPQQRQIAFRYFG